MSRVLLVNPHWSTLRRQRQGQFRRAWPPLDLAVAAQLLENDGIDVQIIDNNVDRRSPEELGQIAREYDLTFVTSTPYDRWQCPALDITFFYDTIRHIPRDRLFVMGAHISERLEVSLAATGARGAVVHEPEATILDISRHGIRPNQPGVAFLQDGVLHRGPEPEPLDLESLPFPAFHRLPMPRYFYELMGRRFALLEASRGCPYRCTFCYLGMYGKRFRQKSIERFFEEVQWAHMVHSVQNFYFMDLEFALNRRFVASFCEMMIASRLPVSWCCQTRVTDVDDDLVALMKRAGCRLIHFGVESGSARVLRETRKEISLDDAVKAIEITNRHGVASAVFMNLGFPGETREDRRATREFAVKLNPTFASFHIVMPFPGTPLAEQVRPLMSSAEKYPESVVATEAEFKALKRELRRSYAQFYLRPQYVWRLMRDADPAMVWRQARTLSDLVLS